MTLFSRRAARDPVTLRDLGTHEVLVKSDGKMLEKGLRQKFAARIILYLPRLGLRRATLQRRGSNIKA